MKIRPETLTCTDGMMDRRLLEEAIADAKAVRATAIANAKQALEEAFSSKFSDDIDKIVEGFIPKIVDKNITVHILKE